MTQKKNWDYNIPRRHDWNKIGAIIILGVSILWIVYAFYKRIELDNHYKITRGQVKDITPKGAKNSPHSIHYTYSVKGKQFVGENDLAACDDYNTAQLSLFLVNRKFYVAYDTTDFSSSLIIITSNSARRFDVKVTDTTLHYDSLQDCMQTYGNY